jgi:uncharacterized delta-60 repeat protein
MKKYAMKKIFFILLFQFVPVLLLAQAGTLDTSFGTNGKSLICYDTTVIPNSSILQADGKIIVVGLKYPDTNFVSQINSDGSLDATFGTNGISTFITNTSTEVNAYCFASAIQNDGKIILVGEFRNNLGEINVMVLRYNTTGTFDSAFGTNGKLNLDLGTQHDFAYAVKVQTDGKILVGGSTGSVNGGFSLIRLDSNGNLDPGFGIGGKVMTVFTTGNQSEINALEILPDGKILAGGTRVNGSQNIALAKYNTDGSLDTSFGIGGKVETVISFGVSDNLNNIKTLPDGSIVAQGIYNPTGNINDGGNFLLKYLSNGSLDTNFGTNGVILNLGEFSGFGLAIQSDNKIIVSGASAGIFIVARYLENGSYDTSFNSTGKLTTQFIPSNNNNTTTCYSTSVLIQTDNKIVASGVSVNDDNTLGCTATIRINAGTLSTDTFETDTMKLFPNPTTGIVNFQNNIFQYKNVIVYNYLGQEISKQELNALNDEVINLSTLSNGVYLLKFMSESSNSVAKIVKE